MKVALLIISLFTLSTLASRFETRLRRRLGQRQDLISPLIPKTSLPIFIEIPGLNLTDIAKSKGAASSRFSSNWAGAILTSPPPGQLFSRVQGQFKVPTVEEGLHNTSFWAASAWVGIDGDTYPQAIFQTGIDFYINDKGHMKYSAWYEYYPSPAADFKDFVINAGDEILMSVQLYTANAGTATVHNLSTGKSVTRLMTSAVKLGRVNAEWIVEDFIYGITPVPLADWNSVSFSHAVAWTNRGTPADFSKISSIDIVDDHFNFLSNTQITSPYSLGIHYIGDAE